MIRLLEGTVHSVGTDTIVLLVNGVGYQIYVTHPQQFTIGDTIRLHTHHAIRETALDLYGFHDESTLTLFELLLKVPKIGPKSALQVMTSASPDLLIESISNADPAHLQKLSGLGKKTAENIVTNLDGKLPDHLTFNTIVTTTTQVQTDAIDVLITLGYDQTVARTTVQAIPYNEQTTVNSLVTAALKQIS